MYSPTPTVTKMSGPLTRAGLTHLSVGSEEPSAGDTCGNGEEPSAVIILCGKRKSGKDFVAAQLLLSLGEDLIWPIRLSAPIKEQYAKDHGLELDRLMDSSVYKEAHRTAMIEWSEKIRDQDSGYFCRLAVQKAPPNKVWLVVDARRPTDMEFFKTRYEGGRKGKVLTVRVTADLEVRQRRGWEFTAGVDDATSECGLDQYQCDRTVSNNSDDPYQLAQQLTPVCLWSGQLALPPSLSNK